MNNPTTWLVVAAIYTGLLFATCTVGTVVYDLIAMRRGWRTVSGDTMRLGSKYQWLCVAIAGALAFIVGVLTGHLFFPQMIETGVISCLQYWQSALLS
jgi:hypothetical protein